MTEIERLEYQAQAVGMVEASLRPESPPLDVDYAVVKTHDNIQVLHCVSEALWLAERQKSLGASVMAAALGMSQWLSPLKLYCQYRGEAGWPDETERMEVSRHFQTAIGALYEKRTGRLTADPGVYTVYRDTRYPWMHATPDLFDTTRDGVVEIKFIGHWMAKKLQELDGPLPEHRIQLATQMICTGKRCGTLAYQVSNERFITYDLDEQADMRQAIIRESEKFWHAVQHGNPPQVTSSDKELLAELYPAEEIGRKCELLGESTALSRKYARLGEEIKAREEERKRIAAVIMTEMEDAEIGLTEAGHWTWKTQIRSAHMVRASQTRVLRFWPAKEDQND